MANKYDKSIADLSSGNIESKVMEHDVGFKVANSETSYMFVGPHTYNAELDLDANFIKNALKTFSYEFLIDPMYKLYYGTEADKALSAYVETDAFKTEVQSIAAKYSVIGLTQQANLNITPGLNPMTFVGSKHKYFSDLEFMSTYAMSIVKPKFFGSNFLQAILMNLGMETFGEISYDVVNSDGTVTTNVVLDPEKVPENYKEDAVKTKITMDAAAESFDDHNDTVGQTNFKNLFKYIYRKLINFDTHSMAYKMPFGLGLVLTSKNGTVLGCPYLENCHVQTFGSSMRLDQPIVVDQMQFIGGSMESISDPNTIL